MRTIRVSDAAYEYITDKQLDIVEKLSETSKYKRNLFRLCKIADALDVLLELQKEEELVQKIERRLE